MATYTPQEVVYILRHSTAVGASQPTDQLPTANHPNQQPSHLEVSPELTDSVSKAAAGAASAAQAAGPAILNLGAKALGALVMTGAMVHTVVESVADGSSSSGSSGSSSGDRGACFAAPARSDDCSAAAVAASSSAAAAIDAAAVTAMAATADVVAAAAATTTVTPASTVTTVAATAAPAISDESSASDAAAAAASAPCSSSTSATASATSSATSPTTSTAPTTPTASTTTAVRATLVKFLPPSPATLTQQLQQQGTAADTTSTPPPPQEQLQQPGTVVRDLVRWWQSVDVLVAAATGPSSAVARGLERQAEAAARLKVLGAVTADAVRAATKQAIENLHETPPTLPNFTLPKLTLPTITLPSLNFTLPSFSLPQAIDAPIMMNPAVRERAAMFARARTEVASSPLMQLLPLLAAGAHAGPAGVLQVGRLQDSLHITYRVSERLYIQHIKYMLGKLGAVTLVRWCMLMCHRVVVVSCHYSRVGSYVSSTFFRCSHVSSSYPWSLPMLSAACATHRSTMSNLSIRLLNPHSNTQSSPSVIALPITQHPIDQMTKLGAHLVTSHSCAHIRGRHVCFGVRRTM